MAIKDRDYRSRALRRNLRKQARKGQLTSREKKELLEQEAAFRDARRGRAPIVGGALAALGGALTIPGVQAALGGGMDSLRRMLERGEITEDEAKEVQKAAEEVAATGEPTKDPVAAAIENAMPAAEVVADGDMVETEKPSPAEEALMKRRGVAPSATDVEGLENRGLGEMTYSVPRQQLIDQLTGAFEASRGGGTITVPEYDDEGNLTGEETDAVRRLKNLQADSNVEKSERELADLRDEVRERALAVERNRVEPLSRRGPSLITDAERERVSSQSEDARRRRAREQELIAGAEDALALAGGIQEIDDNYLRPLSSRVARSIPTGLEDGVRSLSPIDDLRPLSPRAAGNIPARFGGDLAQIGRRSPSTIPSSMIDQLMGSTLDPRLARSLDMANQTQERGGMVSKKEALMKKIRAKYGIR
jgi:hypothetical protein